MDKGKTKMTKILRRYVVWFIYRWICEKYGNDEDNVINIPDSDTFYIELEENVEHWFSS